MGVNFVVVIENRARRTQQDIDREFGLNFFHDQRTPVWELLSFNGTPYATWCYTPRYVIPEKHNHRWEAIRKYLVRVCEFFGNGMLSITNDAVGSKYPPESEEPIAMDCWFAILGGFDNHLLDQPDYKNFLN